MSKLEDLLALNADFIGNKEYEKYSTSKYPFKKIVIFSCMDTRLTELLPKALGLKNGDAKIIKNAGAIITHPFGSIMRSIVVAIYELYADEIFVIGHDGCGMSNTSSSAIKEKMLEQGIQPETLKILEYAGIDLDDWLHGFDCVKESIRKSVGIIKNHPLIPNHIRVHGLLMNPDTGAVEVLVNGDL